MKCRDLMNLEPEWISSSATVTEAAQMMRDRSVSVLLVFDSAPARRLKGVVTDRDLTTRVCAENKNPGQTRVMEVASTEVLSCGDDEDLEAAETKMQESERSRLVVVDGQGAPIGILSLADILRGDRDGRALKTARAVLAHDEKGREPPAERIKLTPSTVADEDAAARQTSVMMGASHGGSMKEFPR